MPTWLLICPILPTRNMIVSAQGSSVMKTGIRHRCETVARSSEFAAGVSPSLPSVEIGLVLWYYLKSDWNLISVTKSWGQCLLTNKSKNPLPSIGIPAWLVLNRRGWPDIYHQLGEERDIVPSSQSHGNSVHTQWCIALLRVDYDPSLAVHSQRWDQNRNKTRPESQPVGKTALHEDWETLTGRHTTATTNGNMLIRAWPRKGPQSSPRAYWHQSQSRDSWISPLSRASVRYPIVSLEMFSAVQGQLHNASSLWMAERLFIRALCDKGRRRKEPNWCSFVIYKGSTLLAPSSRLTGY